MDLDGANKKNYIVENEEIKVPMHLLNGVYSKLSTKEITVWEIKVKLHEELMIAYTPDLNATHFFLLNFNATQFLNIRTNIDLSIDERLLNNQSKFSSLYWSSNVGIDFMLPVNTELSIQLFVIPKRHIIKFLKLKTSFANKKAQLIAESKSPLFYLLQTWTYFDYSVALINKSIEMKNQVSYIRSRLAKYLNLVNEISNGEFNLWELYIILSIEQELCKSSAVIRPDIEQIERDFNYPAKIILSLFNKIFGKSIYEYHRSIHMEYAKRLLETQQLSVLEVSDILGYKNSRIFSHVFSKYYMAAPKVYKPKTKIN
jgi:AraC-like DNA-binding protein